MGKIATDMKKKNEEWSILHDKEDITIEDALSMIELSRKRRDKRVCGLWVILDVIIQEQKD